MTDSDSRCGVADTFKLDGRMSSLNWWSRRTADVVDKLIDSISGCGVTNIFNSNGRMPSPS